MTNDSSNLPDFDWASIKDPERILENGFMALVIVAFRTTNSGEIIASNSDITEVLCAEFGRNFAEDYSGTVLEGLLILLERADLIRRTEDTSIPSRRRIRLYCDPVNNKKAWNPRPQDLTDLEELLALMQDDQQRQMKGRGQHTFPSPEIFPGLSSRP